MAIDLLASLLFIVVFFTGFFVAFSVTFGMARLNPFTYIHSEGYLFHANGCIQFLGKTTLHTVLIAANLFRISTSCMANNTLYSITSKCSNGVAYNTTGKCLLVIFVGMAHFLGIRFREVV
jgi:hypothetical protein